MTYTIKATLNAHSCEFEIQAADLGEALMKADIEFRQIYCRANDWPGTQLILTWGDRHVSAKLRK